LEAVIEQQMATAVEDYLERLEADAHLIAQSGWA
jgi:hypothetical protein